MENKLSGLPELFDYKQAATALHLSHFTLRRWVCEGRLKHTKLGGRVFFTESQLNELLNRSVKLPAAGI